jgi:glutamate-1-semialdehyde aminotransferase
MKPALRTRTDLYRRAVEVIPGGVNSPVRAMRAVGLDEPLFVRRGEARTSRTRTATATSTGSCRGGR